jgi:hypothetical protein
MSGFQRHLDEFGSCFDHSHSGTEMMVFEFYDERRRRHYHEEVPACAECYGLK